MYIYIYIYVEREIYVLSLSLSHYMCIYIYICIILHLYLCRWARLKNRLFKCITLLLFVAKSTKPDGWPRFWRCLLRHLCDECREKPLRHLLWRVSREAGHTTRHDGTTQGSDNNGPPTARFYKKISWRNRKTGPKGIQEATGTTQGSGDKGPPTACLSEQKLLDETAKQDPRGSRKPQGPHKAQVTRSLLLLASPK